MPAYVNWLDESDQYFIKMESGWKVRLTLQKVTNQVTISNQICLFLCPLLLRFYSSHNCIVTRSIAMNEYLSQNSEERHRKEELRTSPDRLSAVAKVAEALS